MKYLLLVAGLWVCLNTTSAQQSHPSFMNQGNIYEVNIRQYTKEGTFKAFAKHLPRLQKWECKQFGLCLFSPFPKWIEKEH
jgi:hypothetical protein